jgi:RNA polymerase sigma-70 factor, ECF subfamily
VTGRPTSPEDARLFFAEALFEHRHALFRFARGWLASPDPSTAEDLVQETLVAAIRGFSSDRPPRDVRAWLFTILVRRMLTHDRDLAREARRIEPDAEVDALPAPAPTLAHRDAERVLEETSDEVKRAISRLAPIERAVFWLRAVEEFDYREIAEWLGIPVGTATSHATRARQALRRALRSPAAATGTSGRARKG